MTRGTPIRRVCPAQLVHRADEAEPVQELVVAAIFDLVRCVVLRHSSPVAVPQRFVVALVRLDVREQERVLLHEERMAPARRRDHGHAPGLRSSARAIARADFEAAPRLRGRRIEPVCSSVSCAAASDGRRRRTAGRRSASARTRSPRTARPDTESPCGRSRGTAPSWRTRGRADGAAACRRRRRRRRRPSSAVARYLRARAMTVDRERLVLGLVPPRSRRGDNLSRAERRPSRRRASRRRHAVLAEVLVLIVAPDQDEIRLEASSSRADLSELIDHVAAVPMEWLAPRRAPLLPHRRMPAFGRAQRSGSIGSATRSLMRPVMLPL